MKIELTQEQIQNILKLINRANISGGEAEAVVQTKMILVNALQLRPKVEPEPDKKKD